VYIVNFLDSVERQLLASGERWEGSGTALNQVVSKPSAALFCSDTYLSARLIVTLCNVASLWSQPVSVSTNLSVPLVKSGPIKLLRNHVAGRVYHGSLRNPEDVNLLSENGGQNVLWTTVRKHRKEATAVGSCFASWWVL